MGGKPDLPDRYEAIRLLGVGGAGQVWLCHDAQFGNHQVAVKIFLGDSTDTKAFRNEFAALSTLTHPNIPETYGFEETESGTCCFALEYVDGRTFTEAIRTEGTDVFGRFAAEALQALSFIHDFGLLHRDLKPQNLLVRNRPRSGRRVVLLDFGLAESRRESGAGTAGTLTYMAPELFEGGSPSIKSDLYALGVVFVEALLGRPPVSADPSVDLAAYLKAAKVPIDSGTLPESVPPSVLPWLNALRGHDPDDRPTDAREALAQLSSILGGAVGVETQATRAARIASGPPPGRAKELDAVLRALQDPETTAVLLTGEAGAGKTRILDVVRASAVRDRWRIETVSSLLSSVVDDSRIRLLLIDELENSTPEVGSLLDRLVRRPPDNRMKVLASGRAEEIRDSRIKSLLSDIEFLPTATLFELSPLDEAGVGEILKRVFGGEPSHDRVGQVLAATNGLAAAVEAFVVSGDTQTGGGLDRLSESILARVGNLSDSAKGCAISLAAIGEPAGIELLRAILELPDPTLLASLDELRSANLARSLDGHWGLKSGLITESILTSIDRPTLEKVTQRAVHAVEQGSDTASDAKLARLWRRLGNLPQAVRFAVRAAEHAAASRSYDSATRWYAQAILDLPKYDSRYGALRLEHAKISEQAEEYWNAAKSYAAFVRHAKDDSTRSEFLARQARSLLKAGRAKAALRVARAARAAASNRRQEILADCQVGVAYCFCAEHERACELLQPLAPQLESIGEFRWAAEAYYGIGLASEKLRRLDAASEEYRRSALYAEEHQFIEVVVNSLISHANVDHLRGDPRSALECLDKARKLAAHHGLKRQSMWIIANKGRVLEFMGEYDKALECYEEAKTRGQFLGNRSQYATSQFIIAEILITLGRPAQATDRLNSILSGFVDPTPKAYAILTLVEALLQDNEPSESVIAETLQLVEQQEIKPRLLVWGHTIVSLEAHAHFGTRPSDELWHRFEQSLSQDDIKQLHARGWLAWSKEKIRCRDYDAALKACTNALEALDGRHHDLAAQVHLAMSRAHKLREAHVEADVAFERGREELRKAADLIEDEDLRNDFLARPVFRELRRKPESFADAEERLGALYDMVQALNTAGDPEDRLGIILDQALRVVRAERGLILLRSEGDDRYQVRISRNLEEDTVEEAARFSRTAVLAAGRGEPVLAINAANDERLSQMKSVSAYGIKSLLCVPLRLRDELVGAVYVDSRADGVLFKEQDLHFLEAFADHAALALENARELQRLEQRRARLLAVTESRRGLGAIVGRSAAMQRVYDMIERVAESNLPVLIQGDSGTGKELVAREIFARSLRKNGPFLSENCAAIAESLLESELFGHVKGAFTGAERDKPGLFEQADGGTLFLDEVGDMSSGMQARLLRVLQEGELRRVGDETRRHVDVRLLTATHRNLPELVEAGGFREDLMYRLHVLAIQLPALRDRPVDIAPLVRHLLERIAAQRGQKKIGIGTDAMELLERYAWPGNVRQLENTLQRLALLADGEAIGRATIEQDPSLRAALIGQPGKATLSLKQDEHDRIAEALERAGGNRADAAKLLGVSRATIFRKIKRYGLN